MAVLGRRHSFRSAPQCPLSLQAIRHSLGQRVSLSGLKHLLPKECFLEVRTAVPPKGSTDLSLRNILIDVSGAPLSQKGAKPSCKWIYLACKVLLENLSMC